MKRFCIVFSLVVFLFGMAVPVHAQYRVLGETGAKVVRCVEYYRTIGSKIQCAVGGNEVQAQVRDNIAFVDSFCESCGRGYYGEGIGGGSVSGPTSTRERVITGAGIGSAIGYSIFGDGRGAAGGAAAGAIVGLVSGRKASNKSKKEAEVYEAQRQAQAQARAVAEDRASREQQLLRNRFDSNVRVIFKAPNGDIDVVTVNPGQTAKINPPLGTNFVLAELECLNGQWDRLEFGSGKVKLPYNAGWEFDPRAAQSICR